ncbi:O-antigen ligase family protein [Rossellomorea aquimaris]|nr:O-antigen ligase family protein [Rossellomorea vietnamensis]
MHSMINSKRFLNLFLIFILFQPIIDILTTYTLVQMESGATFGVLIRVAYMFAGLLFLLMHFNKSKFARNSFIYLAILGIFVGINLAVNYFIKSPFYIGQEIKFFIKVVYMNIVFLNFILVLTLLKEKGSNILSKAIYYILVASLIISVSMIIAVMTSTSLESYESAKVGYTGWFFAGNEIGAIIAIILPILCLYAIRKTETLKEIYFWLPVVFASFSLLMLGTKVGYGAIFIVLLASLFICAVMFWKRKGTKTHSKNKSNLIISILLLAGLLVSTPFTPVFNNINVHLGFLGIDLNQDEEESPEETEDGQEEEENDQQLNKKQVQNLIYSSREEFLAHHSEDYMTSPILQKAFGYGYAGNYDQPDPKMIEMDFYDLFFSFGFLGFLVYIAPVLFYLYVAARKLIKNIGLVFTPEYIMLLSSIALTLGIAHFAGHVLTAPAVSIYFGLIFALIIVELNSSEKKEKEIR